MTSRENPNSLELGQTPVATDAVSILAKHVVRLSLTPRPSLPAMESTQLLEQLLARPSDELERRKDELQALLSELKSAQTLVLQSQKLEAIGSLAAGIAHEINTPAQFASDNTSFLRRAFTKIVGLLEAYRVLVEDLQSGPVGAERLEQERERLRKAKAAFLIAEIPDALEGATEGLERISSIVSAMKSFSHPSNGVFQPHDLTEIITTTATVTRNEWKYVADLVTEFDPELPHIPCLRDELSQVLVNLIVNAAYAIGVVTHGGASGRGVIRIETHFLEQSAEIVVKDSGCGISEADLQRIFDPFFTTKPIGAGTGQGLAIAHSVIVDKHRGKLTVSSVPGEGTTFRIALPLVIQSVPAADPMAGGS